MIPRQFTLTPTLCISVLSACNQSMPASLPKIDSGWFVGDAGLSDTSIPAVFQIQMLLGNGYVGLCTATAVSDTTLVTAGHCITKDVAIAAGRVGQRVCLNSGSLKGTCSNESYVPSRWGRTNDFRQDVAVVLFPKGTFKYAFPLAQTEPRPGDEVLMVGYSNENLSRRDKGSKRWGRNEIEALDGDHAILSEYGGDGNHVAVSQGDSGGPLFVGCKLAGVASREGGRNESYHTNLLDSANLSWFRSLSAKGAEFCGLEGTQSGTCLALNLAAARPGSSGNADGARQPLFPCTDSGATALGRAYLAIDENDGWHLSVPKEAASAGVCAGSDIATCKTPQVAGRLEKTLDNIAVFALSKAPTLDKEATNTYVLVAFDAQNKLLAQSVLSLKAK